MSIGALGAIAASSRAPATAEAESPADSHLLRTASLPELFVNGRFALQRTTGVQRVAREIVAALDRRLQANRPMPKCSLMLPAGASPPALARLPVQRVWGARYPHLWEQVALPLATRSGMLLNLCGAAPAVTARAQACVLHDAAVFDHPDAYTPAFRAWYRWLFRRLTRQGSRLITVSAFSRARLASVLNVPQSRLAVMPLAADHMHRFAADSSVLAAHGLTDRPFLLAVGSANPTKRLGALLRTWSALARDDARLVIVGSTQKAVFAADDWPSAVRGVVVLGSVADDALKSLYGTAAGLVFPSIYEGFGLPILEAMACGCPVVASRAASIPEVCGDAALLFEPENLTALGLAMSALLDDSVLRDDLRRRGIARAANFSWDESAAALIDALVPPDGARTGLQ